MSKVHITDVVVQRLKEPGIYYDSTTPAFGIRVGKNRKAWIVTRGIKRERMTIGQYPAMGLADARKEAKKLLAEDPTDTSKISFSEAYENYEEHLATLKSKDEYKRLLDKYFVPEIGKSVLTALTYERITECVEDAAPSEAAHALAVCRAFLKWCVRPPRRYIPHSPLEGVQIKPGKKGKRILAVEELKKVWGAAITQAYPYGTIVQLLIVSGQRRGEIANLRRSWINQQDRTVTLPDWVTKNGKEHTFPYSDLTASILETVPLRNSTDLLFPSFRSDDRPISGWSKYKHELADGVKAWKLHDLRRTMRTTHARLGTSAEIGERLINHAAAVQTDVEAVYDLYEYLPEMRAAVERYETHLSHMLKAA